MRRRPQVKRIYDAPAPTDGHRVLVDRIWPRGVSKERADLDEWCTSIAPSTGLRRWYQHDPDRFEEFRQRYRVELAEPERATALRQLRAVVERRPLTLLTATKAVDLSAAAVLADVIGP